ncbi:unnamed protein product [Linum trigynum]|uniref:Uncharacterized protein n=1 Tax=Linum trigynum TaxID=586398 RepID=A0AAV2GH19_9ROSI
MSLCLLDGPEVGMGKCLGRKFVKWPPPSVLGFTLKTFVLEPWLFPTSKMKMVKNSKTMRKFDVGWW